MNGTTQPTGATLPDPQNTPTLSIPEVAALYGIGHKNTYAALKRGEIPGKRIGGRWVIPTAKVLADLGIEAGAA